ncbi:MAG: heavy metal translocating P-type ATPase [Eubacteriales bacterium]
MEEIKKEIILKGLSCAICAAEIEKRVNKIEGIKSASVDFPSQMLKIEVFDEIDMPSILEKVFKIVTDIEPEIKIYYSNKGVNEPKNNLKHLLYKIGQGLGAILFIVGIFFNFSSSVRPILFIISYILVGGEVVFRAFTNILKGRVFDENFLMSVATIGAFAIGEFPEGVAVMLFYQIGEIFEKAAVNRSRKSISDLMDIRPDYANLKVGDKISKVSPEEVQIGDSIIVKPGEKIPLDGEIIDGKSSLDMSALTGEAVPHDVEAGSEVLSGSINKSGLLTIKVSKIFGESTVSKILETVQNASSKKAVTEKFITKFARYYTPAVVFTAVALAIIPPLIVSGATFYSWINRALVFLVVSCPCALVISIPLSFFGGIGGASRNGILIKGSNYLEALNNVDTVVFDKTGTLTKGIFKVTKVESFGDITKDQLLHIAAYAESNSNHPIAVSIKKAYGKEIDTGRILEYEEISGHGIRAEIDGKTVLAGNSKLLESNNIGYEQADTEGTAVYVAVNDNFAGYIVISDELKVDSKQAIKGLKKLGVRKTVMLTGDSRAVGERVAKELNLDEAYTELLPQQKVEQLELLEKEKKNKGKLVFIGDGINDAPVLARADIGIAMGGLGSDAAIEASDVVLMTDEPSKIVTAIKIARKTKNIVWQNIVFALSVKGVILILGAFGVATMWEAVFSDVGVAVIAILNSIRAIRTVR